MKTNIIERIMRKIQKMINQTHCYDYKPMSGGFIKHQSNPVLSKKNGNSMFDPFVREVNNELLMCVSNRSERSLEFYTSDDGVAWRFRCTALKAVQNTWEDNLNRGCFVIKDGVWYLYYTGQQNGISRIGLATSYDGIHFVRKESNPIINPELSFENTAVMNPCVLYDNERNMFRMWYAAGENYEPDVLAYAESDDGIVWKKNARPVLTSVISLKYRKEKVGACDVLRLKNGKYCMAYIGYQNVDVARICLAYSDDGIYDWEDDDNNPILSPQRNSWDCNAVYKPSVCIFNDSMLMWYNGRSKQVESIGLAYKKDIKNGKHNYTDS